MSRFTRGEDGRIIVCGGRFPLADDLNCPCDETPCAPPPGIYWDDCCCIPFGEPGSCQVAPGVPDPALCPEQPTPTAYDCCGSCPGPFVFDSDRFVGAGFVYGQFVHLTTQQCFVPPSSFVCRNPFSVLFVTGYHAGPTTPPIQAQRCDHRNVGVPPGGVGQGARIFYTSCSAQSTTQVQEVITGSGGARLPCGSVERVGANLASNTDSLAGEVLGGVPTVNYSPIGGPTNWDTVTASATQAGPTTMVAQGQASRSHQCGAWNASGVVYSTVGPVYVCPGRATEALERILEWKRGVEYAHNYDAITPL